MVDITKIKWLKVSNDFDSSVDERNMDDHNYFLPYSLCYFLNFCHI
jgi:hypothetical protein